jgi:hypothetical protein
MVTTNDCHFSRIFLRFKDGEPVFIEEIDPTEIILSNYDKSIYVKDLDGNMLCFLPFNDNVVANNKVWTSMKIVNYIQTQLSEFITGIDGGTF